MSGCRDRRLSEETTDWGGTQRAHLTLSLSTGLVSMAHHLSVVYLGQVTLHLLFVSLYLSCLICKMGIIADSFSGLCKHEIIHTKDFHLLKEAVLTYYLLSLLHKQLCSNRAAQ